MNFEKRFKKFQKNLNKYDTNQTYKLIQKAYAEDKIHTIENAKELILSLNYNKYGQLNKGSQNKLKKYGIIISNNINNFDEDFKEFSDYKSFDIIKKLFNDNQIKTITEAKKLFTTLKIKKDGNLYKSSENKINKFYPSFIGKESIKIDYKKIHIEKYEYITHKIQLTRAFKKYGPGLYYHSIKFYDDNNNLLDGDNAFFSNINNLFNINGNVIEEYDYSPQIFKKIINNSKQLKDFIDFVNISFCISSEYIWPCSAIYDEQHKYIKKFYSIIETKIYKPEETLNNNQVIPQTYRENHNNICVYDNLCDYFNELKDKNRNAKAIYNKLNSKSGDKFKKEYTDDNINDILQFCESSLVIKDLVNNTKKEFKTEYARFNIEMLNTKYNHLDLYKYNINNKKYIDEKYIFLENEQELNNIKKSEDFYIHQYNILYTKDNTYKIKDTPFKIAYQQWKEKTNYNKYFIYDDDESLKLIENYNYEMHNFFNPKLEINNNLYHEIDIKKAYANYQNLNYYKGVPSGSFINTLCDETFNINIFNDMYNNEIIGFFQVKIINILDKHEHFKILGIELNKYYVFSSSQIYILKNYLEFKFINMSYSPSVDLHFGYSELLNKENNISYYCKAYGLMLCKSDINVKIKPLKIDKQYYNILNGSNKLMFNVDGEININFTDRKTKTYKHIAYYIHSYIRSMILEQLFDININDVFGVKLDSIIIKNDSNYKLNEQRFKIKSCNIENMIYLNNEKEEQEEKEADNLIKYKELKNKIYKKIIFSNDDDIQKFKLYNINFFILLEELKEYKNLNIKDYNKLHAYYKNKYFTNCENNFSFNSNLLYTNDYIYKRVVFIGGQGGSGKTSSLLGGKLNYNNICYSSLCWNLISSKKIEIQQKYNKNIIGYSICNLSGNVNGAKCELIEDNNIKYLIIDEATLIDYKDIKFILNHKNYKHCFIFIIGDIDKNNFYYQCPTPFGEILKIQNFMQYVYYNKVYRFEDILLQRLIKLRNFMKKNKANDKYNNNLKNYVYKLFSDRLYNLNEITFNNNDIGISARNDFKNNNNELSNYFYEHGTDEKFFIKTTFRRKNQLRGKEVENKAPNTECKLFKSIHSFQGLEVNEESKIIINIDCNFNYNLFYTAISRAKKLNQIYIIKYGQYIKKIVEPKPKKINKKLSLIHI